MARLAQPAERKALNLVVVGSSPTVGDSLTNQFRMARKPNAVDALGFEPRAFRMRSGCDTTTPCARGGT
jgi:hypothetical protein